MDLSGGDNKVRPPDSHRIPVNLILYHYASSEL